MGRVAFALLSVVLVMLAAACDSRDTHPDALAAAPSTASAEASTSAPTGARDLDGWLVAWEKLHPGLHIERDSPDSEDVLEIGMGLCDFIEMNRRGELSRQAVLDVAGVYEATSVPALLSAAERTMCPR